MCECRGKTASETENDKVSIIINTIICGFLAVNGTNGTTSNGELKSVILNFLRMATNEALLRHKPEA